MQSQSKACSELRDVCLLVRCLRPLVNSCAQSDQQELCIFSRTHTLAHWCSLFALKTAVGCDPCHVNTASSAPLWKAKVMLGISGFGQNRVRIRSAHTVLLLRLHWIPSKGKQVCCTVIYLLTRFQLYVKHFLCQDIFFQRHSQHVACEQVLTVILVRQQHMPGSSVQRGSQHEQKQKG